jgi:hypothetical protein
MTTWASVAGHAGDGLISLMRSISSPKNSTRMARSL